LRYPCACAGHRRATIGEDAAIVPRHETEDLKRELDRGELPELPPNRVPGWVGEHGPDLRKEETYEYGDNAGISQDIDAPVMFLLMVAAFVVFFPAAYVILWRSRRFSRRYKVIASVVMSVLLAAAAVAVVVYAR
jgi:NADH:ubiquinone oxidoreductase subunit 3 (subunit A)